MRGSITIGHVRDGGGEVVSRPSPLGNPFSHRPSKFPVVMVPSREEAVRRYRGWLAEKLADPDSPQSLEVARLAALLRARGSLTLLCWCAPKRCHAEVVRDAILDRER